LKSAGVDDVSNLDIMEEVEKVQHAGTNRQADMDKMIEEIEAMAQGRAGIEAEEDSSEVIYEETEVADEIEVGSQ